MMPDTFSGWWLAGALLCAAAVVLAYLLYRNAALRAGLRARERCARHQALRIGELEQRLACEEALLGRANADLQLISESVAHDLRNPLNTVALNVHLLRSAAAQSDGELGATAVEHVEQAKNQMVEILDYLRCFARVSFATVTPETVDMDRMMRDVLEELRPGLDAVQVQVEVDELPTARADAALVRIMLLNLLTNALMSSCERPDGRIEVGFESNAATGAYFVRDNGRRFDAAGLEGPFRSFRPVGQSGTRARNAALAARVVERHDGEIRAAAGAVEGGSVYFRFGTSPGGCCGDVTVLAESPNAA